MRIRVLIALLAVFDYLFASWAWASPASSPPTPVAHIQVGVVTDT
jgi:hypothetical protein